MLENKNDTIFLKDSSKLQKILKEKYEINPWTFENLDYRNNKFIAWLQKYYPYNKLNFIVHDNYATDYYAKLAYYKHVFKDKTMLYRRDGHLNSWTAPLTNEDISLQHNPEIYTRINDQPLSTTPIISFDAHTNYSNIYNEMTNFDETSQLDQVSVVAGFYNGSQYLSKNILVPQPNKAVHEARRRFEQQKEQYYNKLETMGYNRYEVYKALHHNVPKPTQGKTKAMKK